MMVNDHWRFIFISLGIIFWLIFYSLKKVLDVMERAHGAEKEAIGLQKDLDYRRLAYLKISKSLNARKVFVLFENENVNDLPGKCRRAKWDEMVRQKPKNKVVQTICSEGLQKIELPEIAQSLYRNLSYQVHKSYEKGDTITIFRDYLSEKERLLFYGICRVMSIVKGDIVEYAGSIRQISGKTLQQPIVNEMESEDQECTKEE